MEKISNQSVPLWERQGSPRGHLSSVDKAVQAHRDRVDARQERTQSRIDASREINSQFFVAPENMAPLASQSEVLNTDFNIVEDPAVEAQPLEVIAGAEQMPMGMEDIYMELSASPMRTQAGRMVENESTDDNLEIQSDEVPKGTYVDYEV